MYVEAVAPRLPSGAIFVSSSELVAGAAGFAVPHSRKIVVSVALAELGVVSDFLERHFFCVVVEA